ncbi:MAG: PhnA domain-containing protein [Gammaproteobacteria bacterium]|nr:PhnA domain-containing protein [Gammaproteobacteria bacterium]
MTIEQTLHQRSNTSCELCGGKEGLSVYQVPPYTDDNAEHALLLCATCRTQIEAPEKVDANHWRCLNESMWSTVPAVQVMAWRMLNLLRAEGWPQDLLDMLYLDEETLAWAEAQGDGTGSEETLQHRDCNGVELQAGDTVTIIKDLNVKGSSLVAKRGTAVRNISLVRDNAEQIEGRVEGQQIVILTKFVKRLN